MAAIRSVSRLLAVRPLTRVVARGYADEMSFTFAAGNSVRVAFLAPISLQKKMFY